MWDCGEAVDLITAIQPEIRELGYHVCLGGGVLNNGESEKDLDLFIIPLHGQDRMPEYPVQMKLAELFGSHPRALRDSPDYGPDQGWQSKIQVKYDYRGKRIDVFIV